jgi:hypothetical protein
MSPRGTETGIGGEGIVESRDHVTLYSQAISEVGNVGRGSDQICVVRCKDPNSG